MTSEDASKSEIISHSLALIVKLVPASRKVSAPDPPAKISCD